MIDTNGAFKKVFLYTIVSQLDCFSINVMKCSLSSDYQAFPPLRGYVTGRICLLEALHSWRNVLFSKYHESIKMTNTVADGIQAARVDVQTVL